MFERFTHPARDAVTGAQQRAAEESAAEIRPEHLLAALIEPVDSPAGALLTAAGATLERVREALAGQRTAYLDGLDADDADALRAIGIDLDDVMDRLSRLPGGRSPRTGSPRMSRGAKKVLELALREALSLADRHIGAEHLLLALVRTDDRAVQDALTAGGLDRERLRRLVAQAHRRAG